MDGFDDLLSSSSRAFDSNPFANPFAQARSASPDPWATFDQQEQANPFSASSDISQSKQPPQDKPDVSLDPPESPLSSNYRDAELSSTHAIIESSPQTPVESTFIPRFPQSPGFRESISTDESVTTSNYEDAISKHPSPIEEHHEDILTSKPDSAPPLTASAADNNEHKFVSAELNSAGELSPPLDKGFPSDPSVKSSAQTDSFTNPLSRPTTSSISQSFANLALGGESIGGWQEDVSAFTVPSHVPVSKDETLDRKEAREVVNSSEDVTSNSSEVRTPFFYLIFI